MISNEVYKMKKQNIMIFICVFVIICLITLMVLLTVKLSKKDVIDSSNTTSIVSVPKTSKKYETIIIDNLEHLKYCIGDFCIQINRISYEGFQGQCYFSVNRELLGNNYTFYLMVNGNYVKRNIYIDNEMIDNNDLFFQFNDKELLNVTDFYFEVVE